MEDDAVFEVADDNYSDKDALRLQFVEKVIRQELAFCMRVNKYHARNYHMWAYKLKLVRGVLI